MRRVLVTGATGFIGAHVISALRAHSYDIHVVGREVPSDPSVAFHRADLLDPIQSAAAVTAVEATHLLHLAWYAEPGLYWRSDRNLDWVSASFNLVRAFAQGGGRRLVVAGTCAEYTWGDERLREGTTLCQPATLYGAAKDGLRRILEAYAVNANLSLAWGRIFYLYGPNEKPGRLVGDAIRALLTGAEFATSEGLQRRDFLHVADAAAAFAALLDSPVEGPVNIGSGHAVAVRDILLRIATQTGGLERIVFGAKTLPPNEPVIIEADITRLTDKVKFTPAFDLNSGIDHTINHWLHDDKAV